MFVLSLCLFGQDTLIPILMLFHPESVTSSIIHDLHFQIKTSAQTEATSATRTTLPVIIALEATHVHVTADT